MVEHLSTCALDVRPVRPGARTPRKFGSGKHSSAVTRWAAASIASLGITVCVPAQARAQKPPAASSVAKDACKPADGMRFICGIHHPEDLEVLPGGRWVIASETSFGEGKVGPGSLVLIDARTHAVQRVRGVASSSVARSPYQDCPSPPKLFSPHGLALAPVGKGRSLLYVVNHGREAIELFDVTAQPRGPHLRWAGCVILPQPIYLNAVAPLPDGGFVTTKMGDADAQPMWTKMRTGQPSGSIYEWRPGDNKPSEIPGSEGSANNGIAVGKDGTIFLSSWGTKSVVRFTPEGGAYKRDEIGVGFYTDNMRWAPAGDLLVAGQRYDSFTTPPPCDPYKCGIKWSVVAVDPRTLQARPFMTNEGHAFSGATTALVVGRDVWLGSFVDEKIAIVPGGYSGH